MSERKNQTPPVPPNPPPEPPEPPEPPASSNNDAPGPSNQNNLLNPLDPITEAQYLGMIEIFAQDFFQNPGLIPSVLNQNQAPIAVPGMLSVQQYFNLPPLSPPRIPICQCRVCLAIFDSEILLNNHYRTSCKPLHLYIGLEVDMLKIREDELWDRIFQLLRNRQFLIAFCTINKIAVVAFILHCISQRMNLPLPSNPLLVAQINQLTNQPLPTAPQLNTDNSVQQNTVQIQQSNQAPAIVSCEAELNRSTDQPLQSLSSMAPPLRIQDDAPLPAVPIRQEIQAETSARSQQLHTVAVPPVNIESQIQPANLEREPPVNNQANNHVAPTGGQEQPAKKTSASRRDCGPRYAPPVSFEEQVNLDFRRRVKALMRNNAATTSGQLAPTMNTPPSSIQSFPQNIIYQPPTMVPPVNIIPQANLGIQPPMSTVTGTVAMPNGPLEQVNNNQQAPPGFQQLNGARAFNHAGALFRPVNNIPTIFGDNLVFGNNLPQAPGGFPLWNGIQAPPPALITGGRSQPVKKKASSSRKKSGRTTVPPINFDDLYAKSQRQINQSANQYVVRGGQLVPIGNILPPFNNDTLPASQLPLSMMPPIIFDHGFQQPNLGAPSLISDPARSPCASTSGQLENPSSSSSQPVNSTPGFQRWGPPTMSVDERIRQELNQQRMNSQVRNEIAITGGQSEPVNKTPARSRKRTCKVGMQMGTSREPPMILDDQIRQTSNGSESRNQQVPMYSDTAPPRKMVCMMLPKFRTPNTLMLPEDDEPVVNGADPVANPPDEYNEPLSTDYPEPHFEEPQDAADNENKDQGDKSAPSAPKNQMPK